MNPTRPETASPRANTTAARPGRTIIDSSSPSSSSSSPSSSSPSSNTDNCVEKNKNLLLGIFRRFDQGGKGILEINDIEDMVKAIMLPNDKAGKKKIKHVSAVILQSLDKDKSGGVDRDEFVNWVTKGAKLNVQQRKTFGEAGPVQAAILDFLIAVENCLTSLRNRKRSTADDEEYTQEHAIIDVVKDLYKQFDGTIHFSFPPFLLLFPPGTETWNHHLMHLSLFPFSPFLRFF